MKLSADVRAMREKGDSATSSSAGGPATERRPRARAGRLDPQGHCIRHVRAPCAGGRAAREWGDDRDDNVRTVAIEVAAPPAHHRRLAAPPLQRRGARRVQRRRHAPPTRRRRPRRERRVGVPQRQPLWEVGGEHRWRPRCAPAAIGGVDEGAIGDALSQRSSSRRSNAPRFLPYNGRREHCAMSPPTAPPGMMTRRQTGMRPART